MPICLHTVYNCFHSTRAQLSSCNKDCMTKSLKYFPCGALQKTPADPCRRNQSPSALMFGQPRIKQHMRECAPRCVMDTSLPYTQPAVCNHVNPDRVEETPGLWKSHSEALHHCSGRLWAQTSSPERNTSGMNERKVHGHQERFSNTEQRCVLHDYCTVYKRLYFLGFTCLF